ncbi:MAG: hypothetical protein FWH20_07615 [Oscillospiraceae bacterium]|nr:hypothetical protein [Oscillospiraceae bacterium]
MQETIQAFMGLTLIVGFWGAIWAAVLAYLAFILVCLFFTGACLITIGITGFAMNGIHKSQVKDKKTAAGNAHSVTAIIMGMVFALTPVAYGLWVLFDMIR